MPKAGGESLQEPILHNADVVAGFPESGRKTFRVVGRAADVRRINTRCYYKPHSPILAGFEDSAKDSFPHIFCYRVPIILLQDHCTCCCYDSSHLFRMFHDVLHLRRDLLWRIFIDRKACYFPIGVPLLIEKEIHDAAFLCGDDRKPRGHCLNERIPHTLRTRGANEYIGGSQILWHLVMAYLPHELHASFKL